jgi:hypothetical protein
VAAAALAELLAATELELEPREIETLDEPAN